MSKDQSSSVQVSCSVCNPKDCITRGLPVHYQLPESTQTHVHWVGDAIEPSHPVPFFSCLESFPVSGSFQMSQFFPSGSQSIGVSALASVLPMNIQNWLPLGWTGWVSLQSKGQEFSPLIVILTTAHPLSSSLSAFHLMLPFMIVVLIHYFIRSYKMVIFSIFHASNSNDFSMNKRFSLINY